MTTSSDGSHWGPRPAHPVLELAQSVSDALDAVGGVDPGWMRTAEKAEALRELDRARDRLAAVELALLGKAEDVAADDGARSPAAWLAGQARRDYGTCAASQRVAESLLRWPRIEDALRRGAINLDQARVMLTALDALPRDLVPQPLLLKAEALLVDEAPPLTPRQLRALGERLLAILAPDVLEEEERRRIEAEMAAARTRTRLGTRSNGDGTSTLTAVLPDASVQRLLAVLDAIASPRREHTARGLGVTDPATGRRLPGDQVRGHAFSALLERLDPDQLPRHGGTATTVMVTISLTDLRSSLGVGQLATGGTVSAGEARRLACSGGIIPVVLGGRSEILDLGRSQRLFSPAQRRAMALRDRECRAEGCSVPAAWCEAHHHRQPWSRGGRTDLADGRLLCSWHHHRAHDPAYDTSHLPNGDVRFHRRR